MKDDDETRLFVVFQIEHGKEVEICLSQFLVF